MTGLVTIDALLQPLARFGVHLGLKRMQKLLHRLGNPQEQVPIVHVAGSNGKGSVCAYLSSVFTAAGYRTGRYTSPHLVSWTERICLGDRPLDEAGFIQVLRQVLAAIPDEGEPPTQFEVITAAAWLYFAQQQVDIAIIEVGLGGRLDATNVGDRPLAAVITSLSREHWQQLGPTLSAIATEKAGILKAHCPAVIGPLPPEAAAVVSAKIVRLACPAVWVEPAQVVSPPGNSPLAWARYDGIDYPLPLPGTIQLTNSAIAVATLQLLKQQGFKISDTALKTGMAQTQWPGRLQWTTYGGQSLLLDGAHNAAAAIALGHYVRSLEKPVTWVMGMLATKDHAAIFHALLQPQDRLYLVPVPDHATADPKELATLALTTCPNLRRCSPYPDLWPALDAALAEPDRSLVLCGSLYLVGYFLKRATKSVLIPEAH